MKKLTIAAISLATCATVGLLAACDSCNKDKNQGSDADISLKKYWAGNENEETYSFKNEANGDLTVKYEKSGQWQYASRSFAYEEAADLALMKTLVLEGSMVTSTNDPMVTLKIRYKGDIPDKQVHFTMSESKATYEWDLSNARLDQALDLMLFAEGNRVSASGTITINDIHLTAKAINQANNVEKSEPADEKVVNEITATNKTLNGGWYDFGDGVYTVAKSGTDYNVSYNKKSYTYAILQAYVKGAAIGDMKSLKVTVKGTADEDILIKAFDKVEQRATLTGGEDDIYVDITGVTEVDYTAEQKIFIMIQPGATDVTGSFTIKNAEFSTEEAPEVPVEEKVVNEITATNKTVNGGWYDSGDHVYTVEKSGADYNVAYNKKSFEYPNVYALVKGEAIKTYKTLCVTVKGTAGENFKINFWTGVNHESSAFTLTGGEDVIILNLTAFDDLASVDYTAEHKVIVMAQPGATNVTGTFVIKNAEFSTEEAPDVPVEEKVVNEITATDKTLNGGWYDNGDAVYTAVKAADGSFNVTYTNKTSGYSSIYASVKGEAIKTYKTLRVTVKGTEGEKFRINFWTGANHESDTFTLTGGEDEIVLDLTKFADLAAVDYTAAHKVIIMAQYGTSSVSGTFVIKNAEFSMEASSAPVEEKVVNTITATSAKLNGGWYDDNSGAYTVVKSGTDYNVTYNKGANQQWVNVNARVTGEAIKTYKTLRVTVKGTAGEVFKINFYDSVNRQNHESAAFTLTGEEDEIVLDITSFVANFDCSKQHLVIIMAQPGKVNVNGTFVIKNAEFSMEEVSAPVEEKVVNTITADSATLNGGWYDSGDGAYTVAKSGNSYNVTYNKTTGQEWTNVQAIVKGDAIKTFKTLRVTVKGTAGEKFRINFYDGVNRVNHESDIITLTGNEDEIILDLTKFIADFDCSVEQKIFVLAQPGTVNVNGTFTIVGATFSAEAAPAPANPKVVNEITATSATLNGGWYDSGEAAYTVEKNDNVYNVTYNKTTGQEWTNVQAIVKGDAIKSYKTLRVTVKGTADEKFKINLYANGNHESADFTLTGGEDVIILDLTKFTDLADIDFTAEHKVFIMAQPGTVDVNGTFTIVNATFSAEEAPSAG